MRVKVQSCSNMVLVAKAASGLKMAMQAISQTLDTMFISEMHEEILTARCMSTWTQLQKKMSKSTGSLQLKAWAKMFMQASRQCTKIQDQAKVGTSARLRAPAPCK